MQKYNEIARHYLKYTIADMIAEENITAFIRLNNAHKLFLT